MGWLAKTSIQVLKRGSGMVKNGKATVQMSSDELENLVSETEVDESKEAHGSEKEKPRFTNVCTFTKPVYTAYLRGIEPKGKTIVLVLCMAACIMVIAVGVSAGVRLDIIGAGLLGLVVCGLSFGQPWMMARSKTTSVEQQYGKAQRNVTRFYDDHMVMQNLTANVEATALYTDIGRIKESEDFVYLYVGKHCYFAILTGFSRGEGEIEPFKKFIEERAVNAKGHLR